MFLQYGFDGVDFDMEHRMGDYIACAQVIAKVIKGLRGHAVNAQKKLMITMAPQVGRLRYGR